MSIDILRAAVSNAASAIAVTAELAPVSGNRIMPPTYATDGPFKHNATKPGPDGISNWCSVDAPGSCANRAEQALVGLGLDLDPLRVDFGNDGFLSTMQLPHRVFDAVLRDSQLAGVPFRSTDIGQAVIAARPGDATALLHCDPGALLFGSWDSTGLGSGGRPRTKWARVMTAEISATRVEPVALAGNRLDPIGVEGTEYAWVEESDGTLRAATEAEMHPTKDGGLPQGGKAYPKLVRPSEVNHGNTVSLSPKGVLVHGDITFNATLSLSRLRRYAFGTETEAGRLLLALMGLYGVLAVLNDGLDLRSGCELAVNAFVVELIGLGSRTPITLTLAEVEEALRAQVQTVNLHEPVMFTPSRGLLALRTASR
ncbi:type I-U CRISPR-associated RAMP protein Csb1/Cas7u [uncultured Thiodictyon sp.]|uniref:type I-G CRISPR-associated RAMP protein Csb1/Cas7g n=1 Tax=uncultured Thiodictyon sp. TaxID=1846217 RepID=UPI0025DE3778|nr:type I-U CRISPR-associated RAMP protein Csb1/Cas7u [uncultured Thiodictyon sp.]